MDTDLLNALRLFINGYSLETPLDNGMPEELYNALSFAQANDITQFFGTAEFETALWESVSLIGITYQDDITASINAMF
jgi:hypothetical protein